MRNTIRKYPKTAYSVLGICILLVIITANMLYQITTYRGKALPNTFVGDLNIGGKTQGEIGYAILQHNQSTSLSIDTGSSMRQVTFYEAGLSPDLAYMSEEAVKHPWWHLVVPVKILERVHRYDQPYAYAIDAEKVSELVHSLNETDGQAPANARLEVVGGQAEIIPALPGKEFVASAILQSLQDTPYEADTTIRINPSLIAPAVTEKSFEPVQSAAQNLLQKPPEFIINGRSVTVPAETLAEWITTTENANAGHTLAFKSEAIQAYVEKLNETYFIPSQPGTISVVDGTEVGRTDGMSGSGIDSTAAVQVIVDALRANETTITLPLSKIDARFSVNRTYSNSDSGLRSLLGDLVAEKGDYAISVYEFGGAGRIANIKGDNVYLAASTYKLYIALHALEQAEAGALDFAAPFAGISVGQCFDLMIHHSDNYCANQFIDRFSRQTLTDAMQGHGFSNTKFTDDGIFTTANDLTNFLVALTTEHMVTDENKDKLLELMKKQIYRNGIPTGAKDSVVANKVGYFNGYRHDTGIVYGPSSTYAVSIMSYGGNYPEIVEITKRIHTFMQQ